MVRRRWRSGLAAALLLGLHGAAWAGSSIDTALLERPWPRQWEHEYEVGRDPVRWRQKASPAEGIFVGARFTAPADQPTAWKLATDYTEVKTMAPDVDDLRILEQSPTREVIEIDMKVLWKHLTLRFEVEREEPQAVRFRLANPAIGEYRGVFRLTPTEAPSRTDVQMATWLKPAVRIPSGLVIMVERIVLLKGIRKFLHVCRAASAGASGT